MLIGENSRELTERLERRMAEIRAGLPAGVEVDTVYSRGFLVDHILHTVRTNLFEGALLVVAVLFLFLGSLRAGLIVASAIPLSMLFAFDGMLRFGIAGTLMSLGAIDFGLVVDSSVIMVENASRRLARADDPRGVREIVRDAAIEVRRPTLFGELIIVIVYLPILTLEGIAEFETIRLDENQTGKLKGKVRAMAQGIKISAGEIILTTDADCLVNPLWAKTIASYYVGNVGVVNGFTSQTAKDSSSGMQAIDFVYLLFIAAGTINLGKPISCIGNDMSFRKKAYEDTGGFENLPFSVTEDFLLLNSIHKINKHKVIYPLNKDSLVISKPASNFCELFNQKKRWAVGGIDAPPIGLLLMGWAFLTNLFLLMTPFFFSAEWLYLAFFKIVIDYFVLMPVHQRLGLQKNLKYFPVFQISYIANVILLPFIVLFSKKVKWKDRVY